MKGKLESYSYEEQLKYLGNLVKGLQVLGAPPALAAQRRMLLSLAESVKAARDCNLNHREP